MENCKYCSMEPNGNIPADRKDLFTYKLGKLFGEEIILYGLVCRNKLSIIGNSSTAKEIKIKYCPMCGKKLQK